jgi:hypothetical protein
MSRRSGFAFAVACCAALSGCGQPSRPVTLEACFPAEAQRWLRLRRAIRNGPTRRCGRLCRRVGQHGGLSPRRYCGDPAGAGPGASLPFVTGAPPRYFLFGRTIRPLPAAEAVSLTTEARLQLTRRDRRLATTRKSRLDAVLRAFRPRPSDGCPWVLTDSGCPTRRWPQRARRARHSRSRRLFGQGEAWADRGCGALPRDDLRPA